MTKRRIIKKYGHLTYRELNNHAKSTVSTQAGLSSAFKENEHAVDLVHLKNYECEDEKTHGRIQYAVQTRLQACVDLNETEPESHRGSMFRYAFATAFVAILGLNVVWLSQYQEPIDDVSHVGDEGINPFSVSQQEIPLLNEKVAGIVPLSLVHSNHAPYGQWPASSPIQPVVNH